jgi:FAD binding domain/Berberine and berberine like
MISADAIKDLRNGLRGALIQPGDDSYDEARRVYNRAIDRHPALIARCAGVDDVRRSVEFARRNAIPATVRAGGHNVAGRALNDGGLVIDLTAMRGMRVDPSTRTTHAQAGLRYRDFDSETQAFGLATTGGTVSETGIAGLTLGGGLGWLMRLHGMACDNLISADVVTSEGNFLIASEQENADLFWALRGGGGQFGIVTNFQYQLHRVGDFLGGMLVHPMARAGDVIRHFRDFMRSANDETIAVAAFSHTPDGMPVTLEPCAHFGSPAESERTLEPLRHNSPPLADLVGKTNYCSMNQLLDAGFPSGLHNYWSARYIGSLEDELIERLVEAYQNPPTPLCAIVFEPLGGAVNRVPVDATAFHLRKGEVNLVVAARWADPADAEKCVDWVRGVIRAVEPFAIEGRYLNYLAADEDPAAAYGAAKQSRLMAIKKKYDPTGFFRLNPGEMKASA